MHYLAATLHILGATLTDKAEATLADQAADATPSPAKTMSLTGARSRWRW